MTLQLELPFLDEEPNLRAVRTQQKTENTLDKRTRCMFGRLGQQDNRIETLEQKLAYIEAAICKGQLEFKFQ